MNLLQLETVEVEVAKMKEKKIRWWNKLFYKWSRHTDVNKALDNMRKWGISIGSQRCPRHLTTRLKEISYGRYECPACQLECGSGGPHTEPIDSIADTRTQRLKPFDYNTWTAKLAAIKAPTPYTQQLIAEHRHGERLAKTAIRLKRLEEHH